MKQKLAIARALLHRPQLVFLDEPTAGLDPIAAASLREELSQLARREGVTIFLTTHNLDEAEKLCQQVGVIRQGKLLAVGTLDELRAQASAPYLEVLGRGFTPEMVAALRSRPEVADIEPGEGRLVVRYVNSVDSAPLVSQLVAAGAQVEEVRKGKASLEEAFLTLMNEELSGAS